MNDGREQFDLSAMPLARLVSYAGNVITAHWERTLNEAGYDPSEITVLFALSDEVDLSQREIARRVQLSPPRVTVIADSLEEQGLLERKRDIEDRRVVWLRITEDGRMHRVQAQRLIRDRFSALVPSVDEADDAVIRGYLVELIGNVGAARSGQ